MPRLKLIVVGGVARAQSYELVGPWAERTLAALNIGTVVVGFDGISAAGGLTTHDEIEAQTNRALIERAQRVIVVADGTKLGRSMLAHIAGLEAVSELITGPSADPAAVADLRAEGVPVTLAQPR
ncbi:MAG TPA: hypothetical protein VEV13_04370 [Candidatus Limnocylindria bacterium]|nr:hypothetical protein [Candidatus Limnocylindria bacterium]